MDSCRFSSVSDRSLLIRPYIIGLRIMWGTPHGIFIMPTMSLPQSPVSPPLFFHPNIPMNPI